MIHQRNTYGEAKFLFDQRAARILRRVVQTRSTAGIEQKGCYLVFDSINDAFGHWSTQLS